MLSAVFALALSATLQDGDGLMVHARVYDRVSPAVVGVRGRGRRGTGVILNRGGFILTSLTATGTGRDEVIVYVKGHRRVAGKILYTNRNLEMVIVKIDPKEVPAAIRLGDSSKVQVGQVSYVLGDTYNSIFTDDQVSFTIGHISGRYELESARPRTYYRGPVLETSAKVNPNNDGGALVDAEGRLIGMISMNYHEARFTGVAIPINTLWPAIRSVLRKHRVAGWLGLRAADEEGTVVIGRISRGGPAEEAGLKKGDAIVSVKGVRVKDLEGAKKLLKSVWLGESVEIEVRRDGEILKVTLDPEKQEFY